MSAHASITKNFAVGENNLTGYAPLKGAKWFIEMDNAGDYIFYIIDGLKYKFVASSNSMSITIDATHVKEFYWYAVGTGNLAFTEVGKTANPFLLSGGGSGSNPALTAFTPKLVGTTIEGTWDRSGDYGFYYVSGLICYIWGMVTYNTHTTAPTGSARIQDLPFAASSDTGMSVYSNAIHIVPYSVASNAEQEAMIMGLSPGQTYANLYWYRLLATNTNPDNCTWTTDLDLQNGMKIHFSGFYLMGA